VEGGATTERGGGLLWGLEVARRAAGKSVGERKKSVFVLNSFIHGHKSYAHILRCV
jgi:hypothetical protein